MAAGKALAQYLIFISGLFFMGLGVALITRANLGTSPISSIPVVLSMIWPVTIGEFTFLLSLVFLALQVVRLGRRFPKEQWLQVVVGPVFGLFIDLGMRLFLFVNPGFYAARILALCWAVCSWRGGCICRCLPTASSIQVKAW
jgi:uncharacterized membrane protein YczE